MSCLDYCNLSYTIRNEAYSHINYNADILNYCRVHDSVMCRKCRDLCSNFSSWAYCYIYVKAIIYSYMYAQTAHSVMLLVILKRYQNNVHYDKVCKPCTK